MWFIWNRGGVLRSLVNCMHLFGWHRHWLNLAEKSFSQILRFAGLYTSGSDGPTRDQAKASFFNFLFSSAVTKKDGGTTSLVEQLLELHVKSITSSSLICIPRLRVSWGGDLSSDFHCAITDALKIGGPSSPVARKG